MNYFVTPFRHSSLIRTPYMTVHRSGRQALPRSSGAGEKSAIFKRWNAGVLRPRPLPEGRPSRLP